MQMIVAQCTSCNSRFKAKESIIGSVVECPMCQDQFLVEDLANLPELSAPVANNIPEQIQESSPSIQSAPIEASPQKVEPQMPQAAPTVAREEITESPSKKTKTQEFAKTFNDIAVTTPNSSTDYTYTDFEKSLIPPPAWKQALDILSWVGVIIGALILILGSLKGGFLTDAGHDKRFIIAGFISLIGSVGFIVSAARRSNAIILSILITVVLFALAFYLPIYETPTKDGISDIVTYSIGPLKNEVRR